eukprot:CAMPEP_0177633922 /NCGR_PEP_ID=MMETSP0447-20121125/3096_1 /TAXON_ID=0 /ORGANISM="Stygamoeba regulata, Strain BSH-02190019" /LENGTH=429 /DNA_ID=CAMNT_0019135615 /DNA_START=145 /DNA_END=1431 /DNA_ORIENTATION=+
MTSAPPITSPDVGHTTSSSPDGLHMPPPLEAPKKRSKKPPKIRGGRMGTPLSSYPSSRPVVDGLQSTSSAQCPDPLSSRSSLVVGSAAGSLQAMKLERYKTLQSQVQKAFMKDVYSQIFFSYRSHFPRIVGTSMTSDVGWGCMIRTAQMMLAHAFVISLLGRQWRLPLNTAHKSDRPSQDSSRLVHDQVVRWFLDSPDPTSTPFSLHHVVGFAQLKYKSKAGEWFGPTPVCRSLRALVCYVSPSPLTIYLATDGVLVRRDVMNLASVTDSLGREIRWKSVLIMIPVRLGLQTMNPAYISTLKAFLRHPCSAGFLGGRPGHSSYIIGYQDESVFMLDPHLVQEAVDCQRHPLPVESFHVKQPLQTPLVSLDPSLVLGFVCKSREEFNDFCINLDEMQRDSISPIVSVEDIRPGYLTPDTLEEDIRVVRGL